jgi:hypothetical protein
MVEEIQQGKASMGKGMHVFWFQPSQIEHPHEDAIHKNSPSLFIFSTCWISFFLFFAFGFLPIAHSLHVQMDFLTRCNFFLGLIGD